MGTSIAMARGGSPLVGRAAFANEESCFAEDFGAIKNTCDGPRAYVLPTLMDANGRFTIQIAARGAGTAVVRCGSWAVSQLGDVRIEVARADDYKTRLNNGATEILRIPADQLGNGSAYAFCFLDPGTQILNFHY